MSAASLLLLQLCSSGVNNTTNMPKYLAFYGCEPATQAGWANLCISKDPSTLVQGHSVGMAGMAQVTWSFFQNAVPPRRGLQLRHDYEAGWAATRHLYLDGLRANGTIFGCFLGDELLGAGITVDELTTAAETVKRDWRALEFAPQAPA